MEIITRYSLSHLHSTFPTMKYFLILFSTLSCSLIGLAQTSIPSVPLSPTPGWTENKGQITDLDYFPRPDILYSYQSEGVNFFLQPDGITQEFLAYNQEQYQVNEATGLPEKIEDAVSSISRIQLRMEFVGSNQTCSVTAENQLPDYLNYYTSAAPEGIVNVHRYQKVIYHNLWDSIDMIWALSGEGVMKYEFHVHPGGNPADIVIKYNDPLLPTMNEEGAIRFENKFGWLEEKAPVSFSGSDTIPTHYRWNEGILSFQLEEYSLNDVLVIDPVRTWGTYYGGNSGDYGLDILTDSSSNIYLTGGVLSDGMASSNGQDQTNDGDFDVILAKFDSAGNRIWATYFGGSKQDIGKGLAFLNGNIILGGQTKSTTLSTSGVFQEGYGGGTDDALIASFTSADGSLNWSSYIGGNSSEDGFAVDTGNGGLYIVGYTVSGDFPITPGVLQGSISGGRDGFISHINEDGSSLLWSTFLGGDMDDEIQDILVEKSGNIVIGGDTESTDITPGIIFPSQNCFIARIPSDGSSYQGFLIDKVGEDVLETVAQDSAGNIYYAGTTSSIGMNENSSTSLQGNSDCFIAKTSPTGVLLWRRYYGGLSDESTEGMQVDDQGNIYLGGATDSPTGIASSFGNLDTTYGGGTDAFLSKFDTDGNLLWGTYIGGTQKEEGRAVEVNKNGDILATGRTSSNSGITAGNTPFQLQPAGDVDIFLINIKEYPDYDLSDLGLEPFQPIPGQEIRIDMTIKNKGGISSPETEIIIYISRDDTVNFADLPILTIPVSSLGSQDSFLLKDSTILPLSVPSGAYHLIAVIDGEQRVMELYEDNNRLSLAFSTPAAVLKNAQLVNSSLFVEVLNPELANDAKLFMKPLASGEWFHIEVLTLVDINTGQFEYEIDLNEGDEQGLKCYFSVTTNGVITTFTDTFYIYKEINETIYSIEAGIDEADYKIFAIPLELAFENLNEILAKSLGEQNKAKWRVSEYRDGEAKSTLANVEPGVGYWIISRDPDTLIIGTGTTVAVTTPEPFSWDLDSGIHLIGNPYRFPISWNDILKFNGTPSVQGFITYDQGFSYNDVLQPLEGAFICTNQPIKLEVPLYKNPKFNRQESPYLANPLDSEHWEVAMSITSGNLTNKTTIIGMRPEAAAGIDRFDYQPIPHFPNSPTLNIKREGQLFSKDVVRLTKSSSWELVLDNNQGEKSLLSWDPSYFGDNLQTLILEDPLTGSLIDMKRHKEYVIESSDEVVHLNIHFGDIHSLGQLLRPTHFSVDPIYPNPVQEDLFIPLQLPEMGLVSLAAYDVRGQLIGSLPPANLTAGFQTVEWPGFGENILDGQVIIIRAEWKNENGRTETDLRKVIIRK